MSSSTSTSASDRPAPVAVHRARFVDFTPSNITALSFSHESSLKTKLTPSDLRLAIGKSNGNIEIWNPRNNWFQEMVIQGGHERSIEGICWCNVAGEQLRLFSIGGSTVITEWDLSTGLPLKNYDCNAGVIWSLAINKSQDKIAVGCDNGAVVVIDISGGPGVMEHDTILTRQEARILSLSWNKDDFIIGGCSDGKIRIWNAIPKNLERGKLIHTMKVDKSKRESTLVWSVLYLPAKNQIVSGDSTGSVKFWDFQFATLLQSFKPHEADVLCLTTDPTNSNVFTAGVDRKIFQFTHNTVKKWINSANRLLHGNDIRSMASYQSKGADFLISGGLEKTFVISSITSFAHGIYRKMPLVTPYNKNVLVNKEQRLVVMWDNNDLIKIWRVQQLDDNNNNNNNNISHETSLHHNYKLVCKLVLKDEENISNCAMSPDGQVLVVGRSNSTKIFYLQPVNDGSKLKVTKLDNELLLSSGAKLIKFIDNSQIVIVTPDDTIFKVDLESDDDETLNSLEISELENTKSSIKLPYLNKINHIDANEDCIVVSRGCGAIDIIDIKTSHFKPLVNLMNNITSIKINNKKKTLIIITTDNKIYELNIDISRLHMSNEDEEIIEDKEVATEDNNNKEEYSTFTEWSKNNTDNLPKKFQSLKDKCNGILIDDTNENLVWFWSATWISRLDFGMDLPINKRRKPNKRSREGLTITDESNFMNDAEEEDEEDEDEDIEMTDEGLKFLSNNKVSSNSTNSNNDEDASASKRANSESEVFYFNDKYKPNLYFGFIGSANDGKQEELIVIERPSSMLKFKQKAFDLPKLRF